MNVRSKRIEELVRIKLSSLLLKGLKDPRLDTFITILDVSLSKDGRSAKIIISVIGSYKEKKAAVKGLESASSYIRKRIGKELRVKYVPQLIFILDDQTEERVKFVHRLGKMENSEEVAGKSDIF